MPSPPLLIYDVLKSIWGGKPDIGEKGQEHFLKIHSKCPFFPYIFEGCSWTSKLSPFPTLLEFASDCNCIYRYLSNDFKYLGISKSN